MIGNRLCETDTVTQSKKEATFFKQTYASAPPPLSQRNWKEENQEEEKEDELHYKEACRKDREKKRRHNRNRKMKRKIAKDCKKQSRADCEKLKLEPHAGVVESLLMSRFQAMGFNTNIKSAIENTTLAFLAMKDAVSVSQFLAISMLYFKSLYTESVVEVAGKFLANFVGTTFGMSAQGSYEFGNPTEEFPSWLAELKNLSSTWTLCLHAEGFSKMAKLVSFCVGLGLCKLTDITPTVAGLEIFSLPPPPRDITVITFVDAIFELVIHFAEGGYMAFKTGSIAPLLYGSYDHKRFSDMYHNCLKCSMLHACGNLGILGMDENDYDKLLCDTIELAERLLASCKGNVEKSIFNRQIEKLMIWKTDFTATRVAGGLRIAPFTVGLFGGTAVGKSTMCPILMTYLLKLNNFNADDDRIVTIKEGDKYMSNYRTYVTGVILDDLGNTRPEFVQEAPTAKIIEICNNQRAYANMADIERKGKVALEPKIVIITKNIKDGGASVFSREPASIARRDNVTLTIKVKPDYATDLMIDRNKVLAAFPDNTPLIPDLWSITAEIAYPKKHESGQCTVGWRTVHHNGKELRDVSLREILEYLRDASRTHFKMQKRVVEDAGNMSDKLHICDACGLPTVLCSCPTCGEVDPSDVSTLSGNNVPSLPTLSEIDTATDCPTVPLKRPPVTFKGSLFSDDEEESSVFSDLSELGVQLFGVPELIQRAPNDDDSDDSTVPDLPPRNRSYASDDDSEISADEELPRNIACTSALALEEIDDIADPLSLGYLGASATRGRMASQKAPNSTRLTRQSGIVSGFFSRIWARFTMTVSKNLFVYFGTGPLALGSYCSNNIYGFFSSRFKRYLPLAIGVVQDLEVVSTDVLLGRLKDLEQSHYMHWTFWIPEWAMQTDVTKDIVEKAHWNQVRRRVVRRYTFAAALASFGIVGTVAYLYFFGFPRTLKGAAIACAMMASWMSPTARLAHQAEKQEKRYILEQIVERRDLATPLEKDIRDNHLTWILGTSAAFGAIYVAVKAYRSLNALQQQGTLMPETMKEVEARDVAPNPWKAVKIEPTLPQPKSKTIAFEDLRTLTAHNTTHMRFEHEGRTHFCDAFFPKSNVAIIPRHMWRGDTLKCTFTRREDSVGSKFNCFLSRSHSVDIPSTDMCLVWVPSGGDWRDLSKYFPVSRVGAMPAHLCYRQEDGILWWSKTRVTPAIIDSEDFHFEGARYNLDRPTFPGLCMAPLVSETYAPMIIGFHLAGRSGTSLGGMGVLDVDTFNRAYEELKMRPGVLLCKSDANLATTQMQVQFFEGTKIHEKSAVRHLTGQPNCRVYGVVKGKSTAYSTVKDSPISAAVEQVCGVPQQWGPPPFRQGYKWQESLIHSSQPACGIPPDLLIKAVDSYADRVDWIISDDNPIGPQLREQTKPLSNIEVVSGIDGRRFIDAMKGSTSAGYPLTGPKSNLFIEAVSEEHACPRDFPDWVWDEFQEVEERYLDGTRYSLIFKACFKDEPVKIGKDKVRVFQAAPLLMQLGVRKYFLPIARLLSLYPTVSECAVGVNAESPEWQVLDDFMTKHGTSRILAGDYSKYDLRMPAQLMFAAFRILIDMARKCGYSERDISIMEGFATEICYAYTNLNGDLVKLLGSNPSGQNLTVYINSIVNCLLMRACFFSIYARKKFEENAAIATYGDDLKGSVSKRTPKFNHLSVAAFLREHDMVFTMPDKTSVPTPYMSNKDCDFLKRVTFYNPELECKVGILCDESIFRSLHSQMTSKHVSAKEIAAQNIDGALMSWAYHGRDKFNLRKEQMKKIASACEIDHMCTRLNLEYDDFVQGWRQTFFPEGN
jgi:hypothetical protein